jgi:hypothetical protein
VDLIQKKSSESDYSTNQAHTRTGSLNTFHLTNKYQLEYVRHSVSDFNRKKSSFITNQKRKSTNFTYEKNNKTITRYSDERYSKKCSLTSNTSSNSCYNRGRTLHYITCRRDNQQKRLTGQSSSTTTTTSSNLTRSTMNIGSDSSDVMLKII